MDRKQRNIYLFYAIACLQGMVFYGPIATLYRQAQGLSVFDITFIESISLVLMIVLEVPWGFVADKIGYRKTILVCNSLFFVSKIIFWKADGFTLFLAERLILSVVFSGLSGCDSAFMYQSAQGKNTQKIFGMYGAMGYIGLIFASVIFSSMVGQDYRLAALLTVFSYGLSLLLSLFLTEVHLSATEKIAFVQQAKGVLSSFLSNKRFLLFLLASALMAETHQTVTVFLNQIQYVRSGIAPRYMGIIFIFVTLSGTLSARTHRLTNRLGENRAIQLLYASAGLACLVMAVWAEWYISVLGILLLRISASLFVPIRMDIQNRQIADANRATMLSIYSMVMNGVAITTNLMLGKAADHGIQYAMMIAAAFCVMGWLLYTFWHLRSKRENP